MYPFFQFPGSLKDFVRRCILFRSDDRLDWAIGFVTWIALLVLIYGIFFEAEPSATIQSTFESYCPQLPEIRMLSTGFDVLTAFEFPLNFTPCYVLTTLPVSNEL